MLKNFLLLIVCTMASVGVSAEAVSQEEAMQKAQAFVSAKAGQNGARRIKAVSLKNQLKAVADEGLYYVFNVGADEGFVIVSGDDRTAEILGYSDRGTFDPDHMPANMRAWLQGYADEISYLQQHPDNGTGQQAQSSKAPAKAPTKNAVSPMLQTQWNQSDPYYLLCPTYTYSSGTIVHCVTGCVATAMAQVMAYYQWPKAIKTDIESYTNSVGGQALTANGYAAGTTIDWDNMLNVYGSGATDEQKTAVAQLMSMCGSAVKMNYGPNESGSNVKADHMITYFDYSSSAKDVTRSSYSLQDWNNLIYAEMAEGRPVLYSGSKATGGHEFVIDGYDGDELFHVNWGWGGYCDGYFLLSVLDPGSSDGIGAAAGPGGYSAKQSAIIGLKPQDGAQSEEGIKMTSTIRSVDGNIIYSHYENRTSANHTFNFGIGIVNDDGSITSVGSTWTGSLDPNTYFPDCGFSVGSLSEGTYKIVPISRESGTSTWYANVNPAREYVEVVVDADGQVTMTIHPVTSLTATSFDFTGDKQAGSAQPVVVSIQNQGEEFNGSLYLFASTTDTKGSAATYIGVTLLAGKSTDTQFTFTPSAAGTYNIWIATDNKGDNVIGQSSVVIGENEGGGSYSNNADVTAAITTISTTDTTDADQLKIIGNSVNVTVTLTNASANGFEGRCQLNLYKWGTNTYSWNQYETKSVKVAGKGTADVEYVFEGLETDVKYSFDIDVKVNNDWSSFGERSKKYKVVPGVTTYHADGSKLTEEATESFAVPQDVTAVDLRGNSTTTSITTIGNPNCLFIVDADATAPEGLTTNIVRDGEAEVVALHDGYDFYTPVTVVAKDISYTRTFSEGLSRSYTGWTTIALPFDVSTEANEGVKVDLDGTLYPIDWFHSADETRKNFWVMEFGSEEDAVVNFKHAEKLLAGRPFIIAVPGQAWGSDNDLTNLPITFYGKNATLTSDYRAVTSGDNYKMKGTVAQRDLSNAYLLNADGSTFSLESDGRVDAFRAYFEATSTAVNAKRLTIGFGNDETTGISLAPIGQRGASDQQVAADDDAWYTLSGLRVTVPQKGIYIHQGKKVVIK